MPVCIVGQQKLFPAASSPDEVATEEWCDAAFGATEIIGNENMFVQNRFHKKVTGATFRSSHFKCFFFD